MEATVASARQVSVRGGKITVRGSSLAPREIGAEPVLVGRDASCNVVIEDRSVSAVHLELVATERGVRVRDLGSTNGTWAGDVRLVESYVTGPTTLALGQTEIEVDVTTPERIELPATETFGSLYGRSAVVRDLFRRLERTGPTDLTVLIEGETGTGKELVAQSLHSASNRRDRAFVVVDCGAIATTLAESTLFGHERGAFTGAISRRISPFVEASGGTVFLDELGELPLDVQPKLLRALAERRIKAVGSNRYESFDARVLAATRRDLVRAVNLGTFRSDLYFRVAQVRVSVPALRDRLDDLPGLIRHMLSDMGERGAYRRIGRASLEALMRYDWPGNVRELRNAVAAALALAGDDGPLDVGAHLGFQSSGVLDSEPGAARGYHDAKRQALAQFERAYFKVLVDATGGNIAEIARRSGLHRMHVRKYLRAHGLREPKR